MTEMDEMNEMNNINEYLLNFEFRTILPEETDQAIRIEQICFPPNEACSPQNMADRIRAAADLFLVAVDKKTGKIAGFLNGIATNEEVFRDEFFTDASLCDPGGKNIMLLGLDVLPEYRMHGLARELVARYRQREAEREPELKALYLTCLQEKVEMYKKMGFKDLGISGSVWGGEEWHDMVIPVR